MEFPHLSLLPKFDKLEQNSETCGLEEDMDQVWEKIRVADKVRIWRQFWSYSERQEDLQVGDYVYAAVLLPITNSRKLAIKWSGPLIINRFMNNTMIVIKEICVKKPRVYVAHCTKLRLAKRNGIKNRECCQKMQVKWRMPWVQWYYLTKCLLTRLRMSFVPLQVLKWAPASQDQQWAAGIHMLRENCTRPTED